MHVLSVVHCWENDCAGELFRRVNAAQFLFLFFGQLEIVIDAIEKLKLYPIAIGIWGWLAIFVSNTVACYLLFVLNAWWACIYAFLCISLKSNLKSVSFDFSHFFNFVFRSPMFSTPNCPVQNGHGSQPFRFAKCLCRTLSVSLSFLFAIFSS